MPHILTGNRLLGNDKRISRRAFFHAAGVTVAGGVLALVGIERLKITLTTLDTAALARSTFAPHVGDTFRVRGLSAGMTALQLFKVRDLRVSQSPAGRSRSIDPEQNFSLLFRGSLDQPLDQAIYRFEHEQIGGFELLIAPMRAEPEARFYEAIFNRQMPPNT